MTDLELARAVSTSIEAQELLVKKYNRMVTGLCHGVMKNSNDVEDCVQECWLHLFKKLHLFQGRCALSSFVYRLVLNSALMYRRSYKLKTRYYLNGLEDGDLPSIYPRCVEDIFIGQLHSAIETLPPSQQSVLKLRAQGLWYSEIAALQKKHIGTIKSNDFKGRQKLKEILK